MVCILVLEQACDLKVFPLETTPFPLEEIPPYGKKMLPAFSFVSILTPPHPEIHSLFAIAQKMTELSEALLPAKTKSFPASRWHASPSNTGS